MGTKPNVIIRLRWVITLGAALEVYGTASHYRAHDVTRWPLPPAWELPLLTVGVVGVCVLAVLAWVMYFYRRLAPQRTTDSR